MMKSVLLKMYYKIIIFKALCNVPIVMLWYVMLWYRTLNPIPNLLMVVNYVGILAWAHLGCVSGY